MVVLSFTVNTLIASVIDSAHRHFAFECDYLISALRPTVMKMLENKIALSSIPPETGSVSVLFLCPNYINHMTPRLTIDGELHAKVSW